VEKELIYEDKKEKRKKSKGNDGKNVDDGEEIDKKEVLPKVKSDSVKILKVEEAKEKERRGRKITSFKC
jgi:hypothetical protein